MDTKNQHPTPENIMKIGTGFWASKILLTAVNLHLFTHLASGKSMSGIEIKHLFGWNCTDRNVYDFLDCLTGLGFLQREGLLETARYSNTPDTDFFLDQQKPSYIGGMLEMLNNRLYGFWGNLEEALRTGEAQNETKHGIDFFGLIYQDPQKLKGFVNAMSGIQMGNFMSFAQKFDFSKYTTLSDIGGSAGMLSIMVAKHQPHMHCTSLDLPPVEPIAKETIQHFQLSDRVSTGSIDFFTDSFPKSDIIVMGNILHDWDEAIKLNLMKKAYEALPQGGCFVAIENVIDDDRRQNVFGMMMSINMLIETATGFDYSFADFNRWADKTGFSSTKLIPLAGPSSAVVAIK
ncbi:MAG: methyltransferase [Bacteroidota bacterium]|nr:methyltransferase [Bacteroidota bacterium]